MTIAHIGTQLPFKTSLPVDKNTVFLAHFDVTEEESLFGYPVKANSNSTLRQYGGKFGGGIAVEEATANLLITEAGLKAEFSDTPLGITTSAPSGWTHNFTSRFGSGNWFMEVVNVPEMIGFDKAYLIKTTATGSGGWVSGWGTPADQPRIYSALVKVVSGTCQFGDLNTSNRLTVENTKGQWVWVTSIDPDFSSDSNGGGTHLYAIGPSEFYVAAVQCERKLFGTSFVNGTRSGMGVLTFDKRLVLNDFTLSAWVKPSDVVPTDYTPILCIEGTNYNNSLTIDFDPNGLRVFIYDSTATSAPSNTSLSLSANTWDNIVIVRQGDKLTLYKNGVRLSTTTTVTDSVDGNLVLGRRLSYPSHIDKVSNCVYDEIRIDNVARTDEEIMNWYQSQAPFFPKGIHRVFA
jgi:hypothetical protein